MDLSVCRRVLLFGGSFDPPHLGHVRLPRLAGKAIDADVVAYIPAGQPPHKPDREITAGAHRLEMLRLALAGQSGVCILTDELERVEGDKPTYTVDTLEALRRRLPESVELRLLIGADMLRMFGSWRCPERIVELAEPVVMLRLPDDRESLLAVLPAGFDRGTWERRLVELPRMDVSSSDIRRRVAEGLPIDGLVPAGVAEYIERSGLYR